MVSVCGHRNLPFDCTKLQHWDGNIQNEIENM